MMALIFAMGVACGASMTAIVVAAARIRRRQDDARYVRGRFR